ncbi:YjbH domain-containing protein [Escherichia coli]|nr:YjbH domain-containing protein [Escherichia coli]MDC6994364.1 YjbH domain-containing protein [Escherichia coli]
MMSLWDALRMNMMISYQELVRTFPNRNRAVVSWTPLTRDGGQMLSRKYQLYPMTAEREVPVGQ